MPKTKKKAASEPTKVHVVEEDFTPDECNEPLTEKQRVAILNAVYRRAVICRARGQWSPKEEAAFFNGAASVFFATRQAEMIPGHWYFASRGVLTIYDDLKAKGEKVAVKARPKLKK